MDYLKLGNKLEHRLIAAKCLKRSLTNNEKIHHIDLDKKNNNPKNLMLFESQSRHQSFHNKLTRFGLTNPMKREIKKRSIK